MAALLPTAPRAAGEVPLYKDTVIAKLNAEDTRLMRDRINTALKNGLEGVPLAWRNDQSGASGTATR